MFRRFFKLLLISTIAALACSQAAWAVVVLDQDSGVDVTAIDDVGVGGGSIRGQTFTVGLDGILYGIEVLVNKNANSLDPQALDFKLVAGDSVFSSTAVATGSIAFADVPDLAGFVGVDLSALSIPVLSGDIFTIWLSSASTVLSTFVWHGELLDPNGPYADGRSYFTATTYANQAVDFGFRTFVEQVPEPATLALLGLGVAGIGYQRRKQVKAA